MVKIARMSPEVCAMPDEKHENLHIEIQLPGVDKEKINLKMHEDSFNIHATREDVEYSGSYAVCRSIDYGKAKARYKNGLLTVDVPYLKPAPSGKKIPID